MSIHSIVQSLQLNLRKLILLLAIFSVSTLFIVSLIISYYIVKNELINTSLSLNEEYAEKIALNTEDHFQNILSELQYSAKMMGQNFDNKELREAEVNRLKMQSNYYNSVIVGDASARVLYSAPNLFIDQNKIQNTLGINQSIQKKAAYISAPYFSLKKNMIIFISYPIFDQKGNYKGFVGAAIYLKEKNVINQMLTKVNDYKKSYMYVFDKNNKIIFHPDRERIGEVVKNNTGLKYMSEVKNGQIQLINSRGVDNLAGFSHIKTPDWTIVSQQPTEELLKQANSIFYKVSTGIFIFYLLIFYLVWRSSYFIASPLHKLANIASTLNQPEVDQDIKKVPAWYYEIVKFKLALLFSVRKFSQKIDEMDYRLNTDPLTGLINRRGMQVFLENSVLKGKNFSVLMIDIDFFKQVNDTYGHDQGDITLQYLAQMMQASFRKNDLCCRYGGEEFVVIIPELTAQEAYERAEKFRHAIELLQIDIVGKITVSIGIASWSKNSKQSIADVFKLADTQLYRAKNEGRNCIRMSP